VTVDVGLEPAIEVLFCEFGCVGGVRRRTESEFDHQGSDSGAPPVG